ncbi:hypothetical protein [Streptomyces sp. NPDC127066]|uniref:hypothetical protein n=1 Tax=Streptomyces sp. NPDC127066 TaxID=3347125 RepID=UPI00365EA0A1
MRADPQAYTDAVSRIRSDDYVDGRTEDLVDVIRCSPPSNIVINVTVQNRNGRVTVIRRPIGARVGKAPFHQVGAHETTNWRGPQESVENWFDLARRAL